MTTPREALDKHLGAAVTAAADFARLVAGYAMGATLRSEEGVARGRNAIAAWYAERAYFYQAIDLRVERLEARPGFAAVDWWGSLGDSAYGGREELELDENGLITEQRVVRIVRSDREFRHVRVEIEPPLLRLVIDRDEKRNAVNQTMLRAMTDALGEAGRDPDIRVIVLQGAGRDFCAGEDVRGFDFPDVATAERFLDGPLGFFTAVETVPKPLVVAVHGHALGFGSEVLLVADAVYAEPSSRFGFAEIDHGAVPSVLVTRGLDVTFRRRALRFALTGDRFGVADAVDGRLVHEVVDKADAAAEAAALEMAGWSPASSGLVKALLGRGAADGHDHAREFMPPVLVQVAPSI